ncbi:preprotein translocase subunit SecE [Buchnera aphidicola]|uniref:preprotein translocase subunit SecE n=1 Tax=Buchnera aphidicola TaxID=9 RepID=UPI003463A309
MSIKKTKNHTKKINWLIIFTIMIINIIIFLIYQKKIYSLYSIIITLIFISIANTKYVQKIQSIIKLLRQIYLEGKKIHWPNKKESIKITMIVLIANLIISSILWILDKSIFYITSLIIGLRS